MASSEVGAVAISSLEARIVRLEAERDSRFSIAEARDRLLKEMEDARQALVKPGGITGDLFKGLTEHQVIEGVEVVALPDFNAALDRAFPLEAQGAS